MTPEEFISALLPAAKESCAESGIPASFTVADAALESGWGAHCPGYNLFGVKAGNGWRGAVTTQRTREYVGGYPEIIVAKFRAYDTWLDSIRDHAAFIKGNQRYRLALTGKRDGIDFAQQIAIAGYATDPNYAGKVAAIIVKHNLGELDK